MIYDNSYPTILHDILAAQNDIIFFALDREYKYLAFNQVHATVMKDIWNADIENGVSMFEYIGKEEDREKAKKNFDAALNGEKVEIIEEYGDENYNRKYYKDTYMPLINSSRDIYGVLVKVEDVTDETKETKEISDINKKLEVAFANRSLQIEQINQELKVENEKRVKSQQELQQAKELVVKSLEKEMEVNKLKTKFISMVSHEFRTPLTVIQAAGYLLEKAFERDDEEKFRNNLKKIDSSVDNMIILMENILNLGRLEQGEVQVTKTSFNVGTLLDELINKREEKKVNYVKHYNKPIVIDTDRHLLSQILDNVLSNAIKYSPKNPKIELFVETKDNNVIISIMDNGVGIDKEKVNEMLEPFKRGDKVTDIVTGTGLGLAIISYNINLLQGDFDIESQTNKGTTVRIKIPTEINE